MTVRDLDPEALVDLALAGERRAIGRLLTLVERGDAEAATITGLTPAAGDRPHVVGVTGAPGAGKSTMVARLVGGYAATGRRPAVLAVDPSSPLTGGAILGDRVRMADVDHTVFVRSVATRGHAGGLALAVPGAVRVLAACGHDPVVVETVGVGQVEVDIAVATDTAVVVVTPGMGDTVQANKAGLLEVADVFVVNKADRPGAHDTRRDLELMLDLSHITGQEDATWRPPIVMTDSLAGTGIAELQRVVDAHHAHLVDGGELERRRRGRARLEIATRVTTALHTEVDRALTARPDLADAVADGRMSSVEAAEEIRRTLG